MTKQYRGHTYEVFRDPTSRDEEAYRVWLDGRILIPAEWNSKGAADAGAQVEIRRMERV